MKAVSILGTQSDAGKSWITTAVCALLKRKGIKVAPFKAQNMSNNSYVTQDGAEIGRAQAVQAEACGLEPIAEMNPILLKPTADSHSQVVILGKAQSHTAAADYYKQMGTLWDVVRETLDNWKSQCDVLILEGAGSPVELNLMDRDIVNLAPIRHLDGKWLLVADIERGGVFAQASGTYSLMPKADQERGLGLIVNKFRGDIQLFDDASKHFSSVMELPYLGTIPMRYELQPESEDGFLLQPHLTTNLETPLMAWVRLPRISNTQDIQPWLHDSGIQARWVSRVEEIQAAKLIVIPGSKNTLQDLAWLKATGLAQAILEKAKTGTPIVGICGGYQMLGHTLVDPTGVAGDSGSAEGLRLLPLDTVYAAEKTVTQVTAHWKTDQWNAYEIHMGKTQLHATPSAQTPLLTIEKDGIQQPEGHRHENIWGTYLHGLFEAPSVRQSLAQAAHLDKYSVNQSHWREQQQELYQSMADLVEEHIDLSSLYRYLSI